MGNFSKTSFNSCFIKPLLNVSNLVWTGELKDNLQNLTQAFGTEIKGLEAKHTVLRSGFQRLESRQDDLEVKVSGLEQGTDKRNDPQTRGN